MSAITTINAATDSPSSSVGIINTNFANLNADKIEAADVRTLTNKTINASNNTITNLTTAMIATAAKTGVNTKLVTGAAGATGEIAKWNSAGDLVTSSITITTGTPASTSTDSTIPTSKAVYTAMASIGGNTQMFIPWIYTNGTPSQVGSYSFASLNSGQIAGFNFIVPSNFKTFVSLEIIMIPDTTETISWNETMTYAASGGTYTTIAKTDFSKTLAVTLDLMTFVIAATGAQIATITGGITANQLISFSITSGTTLLRILGLRLTYGL